MPNVLSEPLAAKADALRGVFAPGERLVLFKQAGATGTGYEPINFGDGTGIVKAGWQKERRYFERGTVARPAVKVFLTRRYTAALLSQVAAYGILARGASSLTEITIAEPDGGIPQTADEIAWRWLGGKRISFTYPAAGMAFEYTFDFALA